MLFLAAADYLFQRWELEREMKMTKQEVREEVKSREGDPLVKARIKRIQREIASRRMMEEVPKADVIVTNPTHIACALKYDETMVAPKLDCQGRGFPRGENQSHRAANTAFRSSKTSLWRGRSSKL